MVAVGGAVRPGGLVLSVLVRATGWLEPLALGLGVGSVFHGQRLRH